jgi:hypothetical protein
MDANEIWYIYIQLSFDLCCLVLDFEILTFSTWILVFFFWFEKPCGVVSRMSFGIYKTLGFYFPKKNWTPNLVYDCVQFHRPSTFHSIEIKNYVYSSFVQLIHNTEDKILCI